MKDRASLTQILAVAGVDIDGTLARFMGNWDLFYRFLCKFPENWQPQSIRASLDAQDEETFHRQLHSLKGVSGNLGILPVYDSTERVLAELRANKLQNPELLASLWAEVEQQTERFLAVLQTCTAEGA